MRRAGVAAIIGAALAIAGNTAVVAARPSVPDHQVSYPLSTGAFAVGQVWFAATQALMALGIIGLTRSSAVELSRARSIFGALAGVGMAMTVPGELVLIAVASSDADSSAAAAASSVFGLGLLFADIGLIGYGILALRQRHWALPWHALPLAYALFQLLVVTPVSLSLGFASPASYAVITAANLLVVGIGLALRREPANTPAAAAHVVGA